MLHMILYCRSLFLRLRHLSISLLIARLVAVVKALNLILEIMFKRVSMFMEVFLAYLLILLLDSMKQAIL